MKSHTNECSRPWLGCMAITNSAHVSCFEVLLAFFADRQTAVGELNIEHVLEAGWGERQYISCNVLLWIRRLPNCVDGDGAVRWYRYGHDSFKESSAFVTIKSDMVDYDPSPCLSLTMIPFPRFDRREGAPLLSCS
jgi:hypothetical protein